MVQLLRSICDHDALNDRLLLGRDRPVVIERLCMGKPSQTCRVSEDCEAFDGMLAIV